MFPKLANILVTAYDTPRRTLKTYAYGEGGKPRKFSNNPKISLQVHCHPKLSAHFILRNLYMNRKYLETLQIEVRIASSEPRNISSTIFDVRKYQEHNFSFISTQKYHYWQRSNPKILDLSPRMCIW